MTSSWLHPDAEAFLEKTSAQRRGFRDRYKTYHLDTLEFFERSVPLDSRVLLVGCGIRDLAESLKPRACYFLDWDPEPSSATASDPNACLNLDEALRQGPFDYVLLPFTLHFLNDVQSFMDALRPAFQPRSRLIILQYNFFWAPAIKTAQKLGLRSPLPDLNWLSPQDLRNLLLLSDYQEITSQARLLLPFKIPVLTSWINRYLAPFFSLLCQKRTLVARPLPVMGNASPETTLSIVIPARNEAGNIAPLLDRVPALSSPCELIFVEGHSQDATWEEIQRQLASHPRRSLFSIQALRQQGRGKADAVRLGFSKATGDILMILDADLSVPPEDLGHFYQALRKGSAEFMNGSRLVYRMEKYAMQLLNLLFNKLFGIWISWLMGQQVKDTLCGTKALYRTDYERIRARFAESGNRDPFGDFELLFGAAWLNLKICDVPVRYKERTYGTTNIQRFRHGWQLLRFCLLSWKWVK